MKKPVTLIGACFVFSGLQARIKMYSNGNVGIQSSAVPEAALVVGGNASNKGTGFKTYIQSNGYVLNVRREGAWGVLRHGLWPAKVAIWWMEMTFILG